MIRPLVHVGDPVLRRPTTPVTAAELGTAEVQQLVDDLIDTMRDADGAGIAAPQIGSSLRIAVVEVTAERTHRRYPYKPLIPLTVLVNPSLTPVGDEQVVLNEGCLSVPGLRGELRRHVAVEARWTDRDGTARAAVQRGLTAGTFQHEVDHLDGHVFLDRVTDPATFTTWDNYQRFHSEAFEARAAALNARTGT
ncbi:peptide deformylase [Euzebya sp.]|uniref:peptide deformylase n=1 Tax=Euzebya sp. TaxID=1971409 RepID=UPI003513D3A3